MIRNDKYLYNSNIIFNYYTLSNIHKKNNNYEVFIELLKKKYIKDIISKHINNMTPDPAFFW